MRAVYPILFSWNEIFIPAWHVFYLLASIGAWCLVHRCRPTILPQLSANALDGLFLFLYVLGYFGARLLSIWLEGEYKDPNFFLPTALIELGSMTLYGGVLLASVGALIWSLKQRVSFLGLANLFLPGALLAIAIGRVGCFLNGDDFGRAIPDQLNAPWWAVRFPNLADGVYRYPVQLAETFACLLVLMLCRVFLFGKRRLQIADFAIVSYALIRFSLEFFRGDERGVLFSSLLSPAQWISLGIASVWVLFRLAQSLIRPSVR